MKKKILFVLAIFTFAFVTMPDVFAATTITQTDFDTAKTGTPSNGVSYTETAGYKWYSLTVDEEFTLDSDIDLDDAFLDSDNNTINLNGHSVTASSDSIQTVIQGLDSDLTLTGTGTIEKGVIVGGATLTLNGNITYNGTVTVCDETGLGAATINGGTFNAGLESANAVITINGGTFQGAGGGGALNLNGNVTATINGGTFSAGGASAAYIGASTVTITGGTFTSAGDNGIETFDDTTNLTISGGTFRGLASGLTLNDNPTVSLSGGTFIATGDGAEVGAIRMIGGTTIDALLASGYEYSTDSTYAEVTGIKVMSVKETSVVAEGTATVTATESTDEDATVTTLSNPKTGDNLMLYISMLVVSLLGFAGIFIYMNKNKFRLVKINK